MTNQELWQTVLRQIQSRISQVSFITWFRDTSIVSNTDGVVLVSTSSRIAKEWISQKYNAVILEILSKTDPAIKEIQYMVGEGTHTTTSKEQSKKNSSHMHNSKHMRCLNQSMQFTIQVRKLIQKAKKEGERRALYHSSNEEIESILEKYHKQNKK